MSFAPPTLAGFQTWLVNNGFNTSVLPSNSEWIGWAFNQAMETVNVQINVASPNQYTRAVYSLATSILIGMVPDQSGQTFFENLRKKWNINDPTSGLVQSSGDEGTNESLVVPEVVKNFTVANLQQFKDPYGRAYLGIAQSVGTNWGLT